MRWARRQAVEALLGERVPDLLPVVAQDTFGGDARTYGFLTAAMGVGAVLCGLFVAARDRDSQDAVTAALLGRMVSPYPGEGGPPSGEVAPKCLGWLALAVREGSTRRPLEHMISGPLSPGSPASSPSACAALLPSAGRRSSGATARCSSASPLRLSMMSTAN